DTYDIVLTSAPTADVTVTASADPTKTSGDFETAVDKEGNDTQSEVQIITGDSTIDFTLQFAGVGDGATPEAVTISAANNSASNVQTALESMSNIGSGNVSVSGSAGKWTVIFQGDLANTNVPRILASAFRTDPQVQLSTTSLTFTADNWDTPQTVVVLAIDDAFVDGGEIKEFTSRNVLNDIRGPVNIIGGVGDGTNTLVFGVGLPDEDQNDPDVAATVSEIDDDDSVDRIIFNNNGSKADNTGVFTNGLVQGMSMGPDLVLRGELVNGGVTYTEIEEIVVNSGIGDDQFNVLQTTANLTINGNDGDDTTTAGSAAPSTTSGTVNNIGGGFTLEFDGETTALINGGASAEDVQAALEALSTIGSGNVSVAGGRGSWVVTFQNDLAGTDVSELKPATSAGLALPFVVVQTRTDGSKANEVQTVATGRYEGDFTLSFDGETTSALSNVSTASSVQSALESLPNIGAGNVEVTGEPGEWTVIFVNDLGYVGVSELTATQSTPNSQRPITITTTIPGQTTNESQHVATDTSFGEFVLKYGNETTAVLNHQTTPAELQAALEALSGIGAGNVSVSGTAGDWVITFQGSFANVDVQPLVPLTTDGAALPSRLLSTTLNGGNGSNEVQALELFLDDFVLRFGGEVTESLEPTATAAQVELALESLSGIDDGDVVVSETDGVWTVEFTGELAGQNIQQIVVDSASGLALPSGPYHHPRCDAVQHGGGSQREARHHAGSF
ncbi:MAG: hypothetical protein O3A00_19050, partial [Planctomycetota bacterium]|nr:hypothetical protein [Planctomycetota bacterium]